MHPPPFGKADQYWAFHLGVRQESLERDGVLIVKHARELADYDGVFAYFCRKAVIVSLPPERAGKLWPEVEQLGSTFGPEKFADAMNRPDRIIIGPACLLYATTVPDEHTARWLQPEDAPALAALEAACSPTEWTHGGPAPGTVAAGVFAHGELAAVSSYEAWGDTLAHISVITHPACRSRGFGRAAVAHIASHAASRGLLPQYRTLVGNHASMRLAEALGFQRYAHSVAVRFQR